MPGRSRYLGHLGSGDDSGDDAKERRVGELRAEASTGKPLA